METATTKQLVANKANAKMGGVKTEEGRSIVRFNARKHGVLAVLTTDYEKGLIELFLDQLYSELTPVGFVEEMLVERIAIGYLRLFRSGKAEMEFMKNVLKPGGLPELHTGEEAYIPKVKTHDIEKLQNIFMRYEKSIENRTYKARHELERLQKMRAGEEVPAPLAIDISHTSEDGFVSQNN